MSSCSCLHLLTSHRTQANSKVIFVPTDMATGANAASGSSAMQNTAVLQQLADQD
jgi:hypothetical protein